MVALQCIHPTANSQPTISIIDDTSTAFRIHPNYWPLVVDTKQIFNVDLHTAPPAQPPAQPPPYESRIRLYVELRFGDGMFGVPPPTELTLYPIFGTHTLASIGERLGNALRLMSKPVEPFRLMLVSGLNWDEGLTVDELGLQELSWLVYQVVPLIVNGGLAE